MTDSKTKELFFPGALMTFILTVLSLPVVVLASMLGVVWGASRWGFLEGMKSFSELNSTEDEGKTMKTRHILTAYFAGILTTAAAQRMSIFTLATRNRISRQNRLVDPRGLNA